MADAEEDAAEVCWPLTMEVYARSSLPARLLVLGSTRKNLLMAGFVRFPTAFPRSVRVRS